MSERTAGVRLARLGASFFGVGLAPKAPGTWGSLAALVPGVALLAVSPLALLAGIVLVGLLGLWVVKASRIEGDPGWVVIDEVAGQWIALLALSGPSVVGVVAAFALFRLFDITKPGPVGWADRRLKGALGVMADDVLAGLLAAGVLGIGRWLLPGVF